MVTLYAKKPYTNETADIWLEKLSAHCIDNSIFVCEIFEHLASVILFGLYKVQTQK